MTLSERLAYSSNRYGNANVFGLGGIDLLLLQSAYKDFTDTFCCEHVKHAAAALVLELPL